jgi:hypothetical protein
MVMVTQLFWQSFLGFEVDQLKTLNRDFCFTILLIYFESG